MKKVILLIFALLVLHPFVDAARLPYGDEICGRQGYNLEIVGKDRYCIFDDGTRCLDQDFLSGKCGVSYRKDYCVDEGQSVWPYLENMEKINGGTDFVNERCCEGLIARLEPKAKEGFMCYKAGFFNTIGYWLKRILGV